MQFCHALQGHLSRYLRTSCEHASSSTSTIDTPLAKAFLACACGMRAHSCFREALRYIVQLLMRIALALHLAHLAWRLLLIWLKVHCPCFEFGSECIVFCAAVVPCSAGRLTFTDSMLAAPLRVLQAFHFLRRHAG